MANWNVPTCAHLRNRCRNTGTSDAPLTQLNSKIMDTAVSQRPMLDCSLLIASPASARRSGYCLLLAIRMEPTQVLKGNNQTTKPSTADKTTLCYLVFWRFYRDVCFVISICWLVSLNCITVFTRLLSHEIPPSSFTLVHLSLLLSLSPPTHPPSSLLCLHSLSGWLAQARRFNTVSKLTIGSLRCAASNHCSCFPWLAPWSPAHRSCCAKVAQQDHRLWYLP